MTFVRTGKSFWPEVYDAETGIELNASSRDMPKGKMRVMIRVGGRLASAFELTKRYERGEGKVFIYSVSSQGLHKAFMNGGAKFNTFKSQDQFMEKIKEGVEALFS